MKLTPLHKPIRPTPSSFIPINQAPPYHTAMFTPAPIPKIPVCLYCARNRLGYQQSVNNPHDFVHVVDNSDLRCNFCGKIVLDKREYAALPDNAKRSLLLPSEPSQLPHPGPPVLPAIPEIPEIPNHSLPSCKACVGRPGYTANGPRAVVHVVGNDYLVCSFCGALVLGKVGYAALSNDAKRSLGGRV
jgi:hypothetical protein